MVVLPGLPLRFLVLSLVLPSSHLVLPGLTFNLPVLGVVLPLLNLELPGPFLRFRVPNF